MRKFSSKEYVMIDIANNYGMDKSNWDQRLDWVFGNRNILEYLDMDADNPILYRKAVRAYRKVLKGEAINHPVSLDATWSGGQLMAVLMRCEKTAEASNMINTGKRVDVYSDFMNYMNDNFNLDTSRKDIKETLMPFFYGSKAKPAEVFGENSPAHKGFLRAMLEFLPGASSAMNIMQSTWNMEALSHSWTRPDGTHVRCPVIDQEKARIPCGDTSFTHIANVNKAKKDGLSQAANFIQSLDGMVMARMAKMAEEQGYELYGVHDSFWCHPNYMQQTRENYLSIMIDIAERPVLVDWFNEMMGTDHIDDDPESIKLFVDKLKEAEYCLS